MQKSKNIKTKKHKDYTEGRIGFYKSDYLRQAYLLAMLGARDSDLADFFQVDITTIDYWKKNKKDFMDALKRGKTEFDMKVVETLGRRALGYTVDEIELSEHIKDGKRIKLKKVTKKHILPDVTAIIFWLKNRQRDKWADVNRTEINANINHTITKKLDFSALTEDEQKLIKSIAIKQISNIHSIGTN